MMSVPRKCRLVVLITLQAAILPATSRASDAPDAPRVKTDDATAESLRRGDAYAHLVAAGLAVSRGHGTEAAGEIDQATALQPNSPGLLAQGATLLSVLGRRAEAEKLARRAVELDPGRLDAVRVLADLAASRSFGPKGDASARAEAIRLYERLTAEDQAPRDEVWSALARLKLASNDGEGAIAAAQKLLLARPGDENALRLLDQAFVAAGRTSEALETTLSWIKSHPGSQDELLPLVVEMARETGRWPLIESTCDGILAADPDNVHARALRGEARLRQGRAKDALDDLEIARAAADGDPTVRLHVAAAYKAVNRLADATQIAEGLVSEFPDNTLVRVLLAETLAERGEIDAAREAYATALASIAGGGADNAARRDEIRVRIAALDLRRKRPDGARTILGTVEKPDEPGALLMRARAALADGNAKEAKRLAKLLTAAEPVDGALLDGEAELSLGRDSRAEGRFAAVIAKEGAAARGDVAAILRRTGRDGAAEKQLRSWVGASPTDAEGRLALGALLDRSGRFTEAEVELREAIRLDPRLAEAMNFLGYSLAERGERLDEAMALIRRALEIDPWNGAFLDSLGWVYMKQGRIEDARDPLERAVREYPRDATVLEHLGDYYDRVGDPTRAKSYWRRALDAPSDEPGTRESLQKKLDTPPAAAVTPANQAVVVPSGP